MKFIEEETEWRIRMICDEIKEEIRRIEDDPYRDYNGQANYYLGFDHDYIWAIYLWFNVHNLNDEIEYAMDTLFRLEYDERFKVEYCDARLLQTCYYLSAIDERLKIDEKKREEMKERIRTSGLGIDEALGKQLYREAILHPKEYQDVFYRKQYLNRTTTLKDALEYASTITDGNDRKTIKLAFFNLFDKTCRDDVRGWINKLELPEPLPEPWNEKTEEEGAEKAEGNEEENKGNEEGNGRDEEMTVLPSELRTVKAKRLFKELQERGYLDKKNQPTEKVTNTNLANIANWLAKELNIESKKWGAFALLWKRNKDTLKTDYYRSQESTKTKELKNELKLISQSIEF